MRLNVVRAIRALRLVLPAWAVLACGIYSSAEAQVIPQGLRDRTARDGVARVIVELKLPAPHVPEGRLAAAAIASQRARSEERSAAVLARLPRGTHRVVRRFKTIPYIALEVSPAALEALARSDDAVVRVVEDELVRTTLADSVPLVQADQAWSSGYDGTGTAIAVLDTGVDATHPMLNGKVISEACFSSTVAGVSTSFCPSGADEQFGTGAAAPCGLDGCLHGTHVSGIAAGNGANAGQAFSGVAPGASVVPVQVFSRITQATSCGGTAPCAAAYVSDVLAGLEYVYTIALSRNIVAVNMSLGGALFATYCDSEPYKPIIDNLRSIGVASVVASGNSGVGSMISTPACVSSAVSVGSTNKSDQASWFSNVAPFLSLFAPGEAINSAVPGGSYQVFSGTSMATPHVAGAWSIIRQAAPTASVAAILQGLRSTGHPVTHSWLFGTTTVPRIRILQAVAGMVPITSPAPAIVSLNPARARAGTAMTLSVAGSGFNGLSVVRWNGLALQTNALSTTRLSAQVLSTHVASAGTALVDVFTPAPGGGTSGALVFTIDPLPTLTANVSAVGPGSPVIATLAHGYGVASDWLGLFSKGAADNAFLQWTYVGANIANRTWTVSAPSTTGTYEFRLFANGGRAATSNAFVVDASLNPTPAIVSLSPAAVTVGSAPFTLTVNGSGFLGSSQVRWNGSALTTTFVSATQLRAAVTAAQVVAAGAVSVTVTTPPPGGGTSATATFAVTPPPSIAVSATTVAAGATVTATLANGFGGVTDWLALAPTSAPNNSFIQYVYVGTGITSRTWNVAMPTTPGTYEFRFFVNGYNRIATSPTMTVAGGAPPADPPTLTVSATTIAAGGSVTATLTNGAGGGTDWLAFAPTAAANNSYTQYTYVGAGVTTRTWTVTPTTPGTYEFRLFLNNGYTRVATSVPVTVTQATTTPTLTVSSTQVTAGASVTVTLSEGYGGSTDWLALAATTAGERSFLHYTYVGSGVRTRTWTVVMPMTPGTYEFRLFPNNSYTIAARSAPITVAP
jgi:subtilisin family serine protease